MILKEKIREIASRRINPTFAEAFNIPTLVDVLAKEAFFKMWPEGRDTINIRYANLLIQSGGIPDDTYALSFPGLHD